MHPASPLPFQRLLPSLFPYPYPFPFPFPSFPILLRNRIRVALPSALLFGALAAFPLSVSADPSETCSESDTLRIVSQEFEGLGTTRNDVVRRELRNHVGER